MKRKPAAQPVHPSEYVLIKSYLERAELDEHTARLVEDYRARWSKNGFLTLDEAVYLKNRVWARVPESRYTESEHSRAYQRRYGRAENE